MAYQQNAVIQAVDYNTYVGTPVAAGVNSLNRVLGLGVGRFGYGQTPVDTVSPYNTVTANAWRNLILNMVNVASHQGTPITTIPLNDYTQGNIISASMVGGTENSIFARDLQAINANPNNAVAQGTSVTYNAISNIRWNNQLVTVFNVSFTTADAARYFFNKGGQIAINMYHPNGPGVDAMWNTLTTQVGTLVISAPNTGTVKIAGTDYYGFTKVGGSGSPTVNAQNYGYYGLSNLWANVYRQGVSFGNSKYLQSYLSMSVKSNGTRGALGDVGNIISIAVKYDLVPDASSFGGSFGNRQAVSAGTITSVTIRPPATTYLPNSHGTVNVDYRFGNNIGYGYL